MPGVGVEDVQIGRYDGELQHLAGIHVPDAVQPDRKLRAVGAEVPVDEGVGAEMLHDVYIEVCNAFPFLREVEMLGPDAEGYRSSRM